MPVIEVAGHRKTTTIDCLVGAFEPAAGTVAVAGAAVTNYPSAIGGCLVRGRDHWSSVHRDGVWALLCGALALTPFTWT